MADKFISVSNYTQNYPFCTLKMEVETFEHSLHKTTNQNSTKVPKVEANK